MKKNRKKAEKYRLNGLWGMKPVTIKELEQRIEKLRSKLADPDDPDDKRWTARWLQRHEQELLKKRRGQEHKQSEVRENGGNGVSSFFPFPY
jgi:hypothetical protein